MRRILHISTSLAGILITLILKGNIGEATSNPTIREVSHEDIRDAILSLVHMFRDNTDKLERHEYRERQLGEQLKKSLAVIEKKQKSEEISLNLISETLNNINQRLELLEHSVKENDKSQSDTITKLEDLLQKKLEPLEQAIQKNELTLVGVETNIIHKLDVVLSNTLQTQSSVMTLEFQFGELAAKYNTNSKNEIENKLDQLGTLQNKLDEIALLQQNIVNYITEIQNNLTKGVTEESLSEFANTTTEQLRQIIYEMELNSKKDIHMLQDEIGKSQEILSQDVHNVSLVVTNSLSTNEVLYTNLQNSYNNLSKEIEALSKIDVLLIQTADNVLDTKRRIEYGTQQILSEVGELIKLSAKDTNDTVNKHFDMISAKILENQNEALRNLSVKIETEISQVWRQIGNMYQTLTNSADALDKLQQQTEIYVNGSLSTMDNMEGKVGQITSRMSEVDDNLNYLLGRLSLVTQEFSQIKDGLGKALDNIRSSFHTVQEKVHDVGPGPNPISDEEEDQLKKTKYNIT